MSLWRATWRLLALVPVIPGYYLWLRFSDSVVRATRRMRGSRESMGPRRTRMLTRWSRAVAAVLGMRMETRGNPPDPPFFLVSNHLSYTDIILISAQLPAVFVAKSDVAAWPLIGGICRSVDTLFIDRKNKRDIPRVMDEIENILRDGRGVVIFPEGTSTNGDSVLRFKPSLLEIAARAEIPVSYACVHYETAPGSEPARTAVCWWGGTGFGEHILKLVRLPWFRARLTFGPEPIEPTDRKELANRLHEAVLGNFEPMHGGSDR